MASIQLPQCPLPKPQPATDAPAEAVSGRALWAPPGLRLDRVLSVLQPPLGRNLLVDRLGNDSRGDGFGLMRFPAGDDKAGTAGRWVAVLRGAGLVPAEVVDVLPQFDAYTATALAGMKFTAVVADPRDVLLNWLVFGNVQGYQFLPDPRVTAEWLALALAAVADHRDAHPEAISVVAFDHVDSQPGEVASALQAALGLAAAPSAEVLGRAPKSIGGMPNQFPAGHWRHYRKVMADAFARLAPVAQRFGYPAE